MRTKKNIIYALLLCLSISTIAGNVANSAFSVSMGEAFAKASASSGSAAPDPAAPATDTVRVRKTDYLHGEHPDEYSMDLDNPENLKQDEGEYVEKTNMYRVGTKLGDGFLSAPTLMTPEEYLTRQRNLRRTGQRNCLGCNE